jgi:hypothetical protein
MIIYDRKLFDSHLAFVLQSTVSSNKMVNKDGKTVGE